MEQITLRKTQSLFEQIADPENLQLAFNAVRRNGGAPGIDGVTVAKYESGLIEKLSQLRQDVLEWVYKPMPVRRVRIPKPGGAGERLLGIPCVHDRVLQTAIKQVLEPIFEQVFSESSFGFRPGRSQHQAIHRAQEIVKQGRSYTVDIDLEKFFDRVNHDLLLARMGQHISDPRVLRLIGLTLRSGIMESGLVQVSTEGTVQGSPLSPLLSNIVLDELDKELEARGHQFCRYADDCNIFVSTLQAGERVLQSVKKFIERKLKLKVNESKTHVANVRKVKFLGFTITGTAIAISRAAMNRAGIKIRELTRRRSHVPIEQTVERINRWYVGWANYFKVAQFTQQFQTIEGHIRRRLRARLVACHKRDRYLYREIRARGVSHRRAVTIFGNKRIWAKSITPAANTAWTNEWFQNHLGLHTVFNGNWERHWFKRDRTPKLL